MTYKYVQELLQTGIATEGSLLIEKKIYDTLIDEVEKALIPRTEASIYIGPGGCPGSSIDIDLITPNSLKVRHVGEGAEIPLDAPAFSSTNIKPLKYGVRINITKEMEEDSKWDLLAVSVKQAGRRMAENETNLIITQLDSANTSVASGVAALTIAHIARAIQYLEDEDYKATTILLGNECANDIRNIDTFVEADKLGSREMLQTGFIGVIFGLNVLRFSTNAAPSTTYAKYMYVYDKDEAFIIVEKRPITVENYKIETHDLSGASVTQRIAVKIRRTKAVVKYTTT